MKLNNLLSCTILTLLLICFLVVPQKVFAIDFNFFNFSGEDGYQVLSEFESKRILQDFPKILYSQWILSKSNGYSSEMEVTTISLLKHISMLSMWNYLFKDLPLDISYNVTKEALDIARIIGTEDTSGMIGKLEKGTVNAAVSYLKEYFSKGDIKVSFGAMEMKYKTESGEVDNPLQYIIMYKRIDDKRSKVVARIYSPKEFIPPASRASLGGAKGFTNSLNPGEKMTPFVVEINGIMDDGLFGSYFWDKNDTIIKTVFPAAVPDFGLKPKTWQEKYIINPIKSTIDSFSGLFSFFTGSENNLTEYIFKDETNKEAINEEVKAMSENSLLEQDYPIKVIEEKSTEDKKITEEEIEKKKEVEEKEKKLSEKEEKIEKEKEKKVEEKINPIVCSKSSQLVSSYSVIINEVAWMGTESSANNEWIELRNVSTAEVNLKGWTLRDKEDQINIVFEDITVPRGGFLLLERTDDNSVPFKTADLIYKGSLSNSGEELYLFDSSCELKDYTSGDPKWPAGDNGEKKTMERDTDLSGWHDYSDGNNNGIWGTPKDNNSNKALSLTVKNKNNSSVSASTAIFSGGLDVQINYCSQFDLLSPDTSKIIINEVAWMGSNNSANDEWIELKNVSSESIDLNGWQLLDRENIKIVFNNSTLLDSQEFYLLERTNDDSVPNIKADKEYSGSLSNNNESIRLFDSSCKLMDEVVASPNWPAGDSELKKTMERNADLSGWHTYWTESIDAVSSLWGTPKAENSVKVSGNKEGEDNSSHLLITEIEVGENKENEYIELYNQTENPIELCSSDDNCYYLSYYSSNSEWYNPYRNWKFPDGATIGANSYYIIDIFGDSGDPMIGNMADWKVKNAKDEYYQVGQLGNSSGSVSLFSNNPEYVKDNKKEGDVEPSDEEKTTKSTSLKIDTVSWGNDGIVKEGESFIISMSGKVIGRKWASGKYIDTNDNLNDFELENPSLRNHAPKSPEKIQDLTASINNNLKNSVLLSWTIPFDDDTASENLNYEIYYSRNDKINDNSLINIKEYVDIDIASKENNKMIATINDLFYDSDYYFKIIAKDPENNISPLSEEIPFSIDPANHQKRAPYYDFKRSGHSQFSGPIGRLAIADATIVAQGNQNFAFNNNFSSTIVIDENGTIYFWGSDNRSSDFYAYNSSQKKWSINFPEVCGFYPSLGKDGTIYLSCEHSIYALSPSGKIVWEKDYSRVLSKSIAIDSKENIYFLAQNEENEYYLISIDKDGVEKKLYKTSLDPNLRSEIVLDDSDNVFFALRDFIVKYNNSNGEVTERQLFPRYEEGYSGPIDVVANISHLVVSFDGKILVTIDNGKLMQPTNISSVLYALDDTLSQTLWFKDDFFGPLGFDENQFYYLRRISNTPISYIGAASFDGSVIWERNNYTLNYIASDASNMIYFSRNSQIFGYDLNNMPEDSEDSLFYIASTDSYMSDIISIGNGVVYFSDEQRVYKINTPD